MKIAKIYVQNFRLLRDFTIDVEKELSLIIGKNNTGKTSILSVLDKFLGQSEKVRFTIDDFNIEFKKELKQIIEQEEVIDESDYILVGIKLKLYIKYEAEDNLANLSRVMMDLDPENNNIVLGYEYILSITDYLRLRSDFREFQVNENNKREEKPDYVIRTIFDFLQDRHSNYFKLSKKSFKYDIATDSAIEEGYIDLIREEISTKDIINFKYISAKRDVTNKEIDKTLSTQTSRIYKSAEANDEQNRAVENFKDKLSETDNDLSEIYKTMFDDIVKKVRSFGGIKINESEIEIISTLKHRELLEGNTTVVYKHDAENHLPEHYNGLGYMNLISMIFEIEILLHDFKREKEKKPADINLLFIEEPEAHTHPQMQYVFIKNIKQLLGQGVIREDGENRDLQYIITTHSSCIVADSDFDDLKYLKKESINGVIAKNLKDLKREYDEGTSQYQFLKQYLTIDRAEIFFADKAILIEGDTERILVPTLMRKIDLEEKARLAAARQEDTFLPLLSQNISIVEVGAYSQIFEKFIDFLGIKSLIITDIDSVDDNDKKCRVANGTNYSNEAIRFFFNNPTLAQLTGFTIANKLFNKVAGVWTNQADGKVCIVYQILEGNYNARSFEDAFIHINKAFIAGNKDDFKGLQNKDDFDDNANDAFALATSCVKKKTHFALDILYNSNENLSNWQVPSYIKEGLLWLKQD